MVPLNEKDERGEKQQIEVLGAYCTCAVNNKKVFFHSGEMIYVIMWNFVSVGGSFTRIDFQQSAMEIVINLLFLCCALSLLLLFDWNANASLHMKLTAKATQQHGFPGVGRRKQGQIESQCNHDPTSARSAFIIAGKAFWLEGSELLQSQA